MFHEIAQEKLFQRKIIEDKTEDEAEAKIPDKEKKRRRKTERQRKTRWKTGLLQIINVVNRLGPVGLRLLDAFAGK